MSVVTAAGQSLRVLVIDDNPILCAGLERWLSREPGITSVESQTDWRKAEAHTRDHRPDIVLLDIDLPGISGLDLIAGVIAACPTCKVVMLSGLVTREMVERALDRGATGYLVKDQEARAMAALIRRAADGTVVLSPAAEAALAGA